MVAVVVDISFSTDAHGARAAPWPSAHSLHLTLDIERVGSARGEVRSGDWHSHALSSADKAGAGHTGNAFDGGVTWTSLATATPAHETRTEKRAEIAAAVGINGAWLEEGSADRRRPADSTRVLLPRPAGAGPSLARLIRAGRTIGIQAAVRLGNALVVTWPRTERALILGALLLLATALTLGCDRHSHNPCAGKTSGEYPEKRPPR
jgi:hypothetical protein